MSFYSVQRRWPVVLQAALYQFILWLLLWLCLPVLKKEQELISKWDSKRQFFYDDMARTYFKILKKRTYFV